MSADPRKVLARWNMFAMSNLSPRSTGVRGCVIWCSSGDFEGKSAQHGPRVKIMLGGKVTTENLAAAVTVTLTDPPRIVDEGELPGRLKKQVFKFIELNLAVLLQYWNQKIDSVELARSLHSL